MGRRTIWSTRNRVRLGAECLPQVTRQEGRCETTSRLLRLPLDPSRPQNSIECHRFQFTVLKMFSSVKSPGVCILNEIAWVRQQWVTTAMGIICRRQRFWLISIAVFKPFGLGKTTLLQFCHELAGVNRTSQKVDASPHRFAFRNHPRSCGGDQSSDPVSTRFLI